MVAARSVGLGTVGPVASAAEQLTYLAPPSMHRSAMEEVKDTWDKADIIGKLAGSLLIPVVVLWASYRLNGTLQERAAEQKTVELAITILQSDKADRTPQLKTWALGVLKSTTTSASQPLSKPVIDELERAPLPGPGSISGARFPVVGKSFTPEEFREYVSTQNFDKWHPQFMVLHDTVSPSLREWSASPGIPQLQKYSARYGTLGWSGGPHLFIDDKAIWVFNPLTKPGVHSPSWNKVSIGVVMVGNYSVEPLNDKVLENTVQAIAILDAALGLEPTNLRFHREDPKTTHTECPGRNVDKNDLIRRIIARLGGAHSG
jgi:hypothetical protein